ncbi:MAG: TonB-dependent receptor [Ghiorsea sp.]
MSLFASPSLAAEFQLTVLQKGSGDPVEGATVLLKNNGYTTTDEQGVALFSSVKPQSADVLDELKILNQGYDTLEQSIQGNPSKLDIYLSPNLAELEGLEVVEDRTVEKVSKVVLSAQELRGAAGTQGDPIKALQSLPGVVSSNGSSAGQVYMRGSDSQENIYWANNLPISYLYHWGGLNSVINPALVSDFNVFLGGFPVEYGDFLGGAVDIKLRAPKKDRMHTSLHLGTYESSILVEGPITENDSFYFAARRSYIDLLFSPDSLSKFAGGDGKNQLLLVPQFYDMQALYRHETDTGYVDVQYFNAADKVELLLNDAGVRDPELAGALKVDTSSETIGLNWEQQINDTLSQHLTAGVVNSSQYFQVGSDPYGEPYYTDIVAHNYFLRPSLDWQSSDQATTTFGLDLGKIDLPISLYIAAPPDSNAAPNAGGFTSLPKYRVNRNVSATSYSPYIKQQYQWNDKLKTSLGLRYTSSWADQGSNATIYNEHAFSPRFSAEYALNKDTTLLTSWGDYFQRPRGFQQLADFGNPTLRFTRAQHRIIGVDRKLDDIWSLKVEAYHKPMRDLVVGIQNASPPDNYLNQGKGVAYGMDIFLKRKYENRRLGWLSYSYARSKRTNQTTGLTSPFAGDQPHTLTAVWGQPFTDDNGNDSPWDWGIKFQAHSGLPYTPIVGRVQETGTGRWLPVYGGYNSSRLPVYAKLDVRFSKEVLYDTWKIKYVFDIQNVTFRQNVSQYTYEPDYSDFASPKAVSSDFFLPFFGIEAEF